ncbi:MAG: hypothetical protein HKP27_00425 [Myxococcales bacterium]|nr:hypothetical protein [Myxococcales bacterium]
MPAAPSARIPRRDSRRLARWFQRACDPMRKSLAFVLLLAMTGFPPAAAAPNPASRAGIQDPDDLLVVDCLLPARVRKMGRKFTYLSPRKPVKTTGLDCEIRGGEYVSYDRADYQTALRVWKDAAEGGDATAQNYVGEIYERGLGTSPDYAAAAHWYRKAAEQNFAAAQINLGQLYERGLGVSADMETAVSWYRKASGLEGSKLAFVTAPEAGAQVASLRRELAESQREKNKLQSAIARLEGEIKASRNKRSDGEVSGSKERERLASERAELERARRELDGARDDVAKREQRLAAEREKVLALQRAAEAPGARREKLDGEATALAGRAAEVEQERVRLESRAMELDRRERDLVEREAAGATQDTLAAERQKLAAERGEVGAQQASLAAEAADLKNQRAQLERERIALAEEAEQREQELAERAAGLARLEKDIKASQTALFARNDAMAARESEVASREAELKSRSEELAALDREIKRLREQAEVHKTQVASLAGSAPQQVSAEVVGPSIQVIEPELGLTRAVRPVFVASGNMQRIVGRVEAPAGLLSITLNSEAVSVNRHGIFQRDVAVGNEGTDVQIVAVDELGKRATRSFSLQRTGVRTVEPPAVAAAPPRRPKLPPINFGNYHALVIGNNNYRSLPTLDTARNDAEVDSRILKTKYGFNVTTLYDADRYQTLSALNNLRRDLTEKDNLLIYYAGHGELDKTNMRGHWLPVDAEAESTANWISNVALTDMLNSMNARHVLVVADSCYSGALTRSSLARLDGGLSDEARVKWIETMVAKRSRTALTSGGLAPVLDSGGGRHSIFARALIDVLEGNEAVLEAQRVFQEVSARVTYEAPIEQLPQYSPIRFAGHESGDFFFVPAVLPAS